MLTDSSELDLSGNNNYKHQFLLTKIFNPLGKVKRNFWKQKEMERLVCVSNVNVRIRVTLRDKSLFVVKEKSLGERY